VRSIGRLRSGWLVAGALLAALLAIMWGLVFGGLQLGRVDPVFSLPGRVMVAVLFAVFIARQPMRMVLLMALGLLALSLALDILIGVGLAGHVAWRQIVFALTIESAVLAVAIGIVRLGKATLATWTTIALGVGTIAAMAGAALITPWFYAVGDEQDKPRVTVMAGVPIDWQGPADMGAILAGTAKRSPVAQVLEGRFAVSRIDAIDADALQRVSVLLLVHPRALSPAEMAALDAWVRDGGRALIFADGLLSWPPLYSLGDVRNPPVTSLLTPMLDHWGLDLAAPADEGGDLFVADGIRVLAASSGRFRSTKACRVTLAGRRADCDLGKGRAVLVADADLFDPELWSDGRPNPAYWVQGNMGWVASLLDRLAEVPARRAFEPVWIVPRG